MHACAGQHAPMHACMALLALDWMWSLCSLMLHGSRAVQMAQRLCRDIFEVLKNVKRTRDMSLNEVKLIVMIEDPRAREQRAQGIEVRSARGTFITFGAERGPCKSCASMGLASHAQVHCHHSVIIITS